MDLEIIYRDEYLVAINKPAGLLVHRSPIDRHETRFALQLLRDQIGQRVYPVHRLDKPTSGVLLFALSPDIARKISELFQAHQVHKEYLAVVRGFSPGHGDIDYALKEKLDKIADCKVRPDKPAQEAQTRFRTLAKVELSVLVDRYPQTRYSLVQLQPVTGRRHQLRRHMKHIGHPIIGDAKHGKGVHNRFFASEFGCDRLLLASISLGFTHPVNGKVVTLNAQLGQRFTRVITEFDWSDTVASITG
ncbi:MAG: tRNA pseudouridine65 synthase [Alcanivorax sp.]|jgi:tRNA pseudouridine65 synthase